MLRFKYLFILFMMLCLCSVRAQRSVRIVGKVIDEQNKPLEFVHVQIKGTMLGTVTNRKGDYDLPIVKEDSIVIQFSSIGYERIIRVLKAAAGEVRLNVRMYPIDSQLGEVTVSSGRRQTNSMQRIENKDFRLMPDASGGSIESILATFAGVHSNNELSSQYTVRGGNFDENIVYVNGIEVYRPMLISSGQQEGLSFINPDMVSDIQFSSGGYSAEYGDKMASVLDITYKTPEKFEGAFSLGLMGGSVSIGQSSKRFSQLHGVRYKSNVSLLGSLDTKGEYNPHFFDYQTFLTYRFSDKWALQFLGNISVNSYSFVPQTRETKFGTLQEAKQLTIFFDGQEKDLFQTLFGAFSLNWTPVNQSLLTLNVSAYSADERINYDVMGEYWLDDVGTLGQEKENNGAWGVGTYLIHARNRLQTTVTNASLKFSKRMENHDLKTAISFQIESHKDKRSEWEMRDSAGYSLPHDGHTIPLVYSLFSDNHIRSSRISAYVQDTYRKEFLLGYLSMTGGIRAAYWNYNNEFIISPRLSLGFVPAKNEALTLRFSAGLYYQSPFYKELLLGQYDQYNNYTLKANRNIRSQQSIHLVLGGDYTFKAVGRPFKFTGEVYYKPMFNLISYTVDNLQIRYSGVNDTKGYTAGVDMKLFGEFVPGVDSWLSLSFMNSKEQWAVSDPMETISYTYLSRPTEQRYSVSLYFQDYIPGFPKYKFSLKGVFADGLPIGKTGNKNRATPYRRVDVGAYRLLASNEDAIMKKGFFRNFKNIWIGIDVFNLLGIQNVSSYYWVTDINNTQYAVPNYLTGRQFNIRLSAEF